MRRLVREVAEWFRALAEPQSSADADTRAAATRLLALQHAERNHRETL